MSSAAKRMLEKMGWKEGEGLGKDRAGVKSYVKVVRRDPKSAAGLGHIADPNTGNNLNTAHAIELDAVYEDLRKRKAHKRARSDSDSEDDDAVDSDTGDVARSKMKRVGTSSNEDAEDVGSSSSSSSSSSGNEEDVSRVDVTKLSDAELFKRCGGVRLGRAGRHRFFSGKLARIDASHGRSGTTKRDVSSSDSD